MPSSPLRLVLTTLCLAVLAAQIDTAVVNLAMRPIGLDLEADMRSLQWVLDSYNLAYAALLLTGGLLADLYGRRRTFIAGSAILSIATLMCAAAPSTEILIAARALSGLGAALLVPASLAIIRVAWLEPAERSRVLGIWAACNGLAMALGPTLGGMLIEYAGWRSILLVVAPIGATAVALAWSCIPESSDPGKQHFDGAAQLSGAAALGMLAFAAIECREAPYRALAALLAGATALAVFVRIEARQGSSTMVPPALFRSRPFRGAMAATAGMTFGMYGALFLLLLAWQDAGRFGPLGAGIALMPTALTFVTSSPWSGLLAVRHGTRPLAAIDEAREPFAFQHQVRQAGIAVRDDQILRVRPAGQQLLPHLCGAPSLARAVEGRLVHQPGLQTPARIGQPMFQAMVERAILDRSLVQNAQGHGGHPQHQGRLQVERGRHVLAGHRAHQQVMPALMPQGIEHCGRGQAHLGHPAQALDFAGQFAESRCRLRLQEDIRLAGAHDTEHIRSRRPNGLAFEAGLREFHAPRRGHIFLSLLLGHPYVHLTGFLRRRHGALSFFMRPVPRALPPERGSRTCYRHVMTKTNDQFWGSLNSAAYP